MPKGLTEVDAISDAIIATEREVAHEAWGNGDDDGSPLDETGDRSIEMMGEGLEGQHEPDDNDEDEDAQADESGEESDGEEGDGKDGAKDGEKDGEKAADDKTGQQADDGKGKEPAADEPRGRVPSGTYRQVAERARAAEAERDDLRKRLEAAETERTDSRKALDALNARIDGILQATNRQAPAQQTTERTDEPAASPDLFEDPKGFIDDLKGYFHSELSKRDQMLAAQRVETSFAIAHGFHKETFDEAYQAINKLNPNDPDDRSTVQRIYKSPNPGEALVNWHRNRKALSEIGPDVEGFRARTRQAVRDELIKDPEFRKELLASLRTEAGTGDNGNPRTVIRPPRSLNGAQGSNLRGGNDASQFDDSDQAVAESAWK